MTFDELKHVWQSQPCREIAPVDVTLLTKLLHREQNNWKSLILRRDTLEVAVCCFMFPLCLYLAIKESLPPMYLVAGAVLFVGGFFIVDRMLQRDRQPRENQPLVEFVTRSVDQVDHQIWLLRHVFWWYLLPPGVGIVAVLSYVLYLVLQDGLSSRADLWALLYLTGVATLTALTFWGVYRLNQGAVRRELLPRQQELKALLDMFSHSGHDGAL